MDLLWLVCDTQLPLKPDVFLSLTVWLLEVVSPTSHMLPYHFCCLACLIFMFLHPTEFTLFVVNSGHMSQSCLLSDHRTQFFR